MADNKSRRSVIKNLLAGTASITAASSVKAFSQFNKKPSPMSTLHGNINHSVCRWCFNSLSVEELCLAIREIGFDAIDLVGPKDWPTLQKYGVFSSMCNGAEINLVDGFAEKNFHATLVKNYSDMIPLVAKAGYKNLI
jgi:hydroxypyruvate isomerase